MALLLAVLLLWPAAARAQEENRAGLVIVHGDGSVVRQCVTFTEESISGYELLQRAGGALNVEAGAMGATVCSIGGEGCSYPAESCFCRCQGSPCVYWSYWRLQEDGGWRYQPLGAGNTRVQNGDVEAWRWAEGTRQDAPQPPPVALAEICSPAAEEPAVAAAENTPARGATPAAATEVSATVTSATAMVATDPLTPLPSLWLLGGAILLPATALLLWALVRRGR